MNKIGVISAALMISSASLWGGPSLQEIGESISIVPSSEPPHIEPTHWDGFSTHKARMEFREGGGLGENWGWTIEKRFPAGFLVTVSGDQSAVLRRTFSDHSILTEMENLWIPELRKKRKPMASESHIDDGTILINTIKVDGVTSQFATTNEHGGIETGEVYSATGENPPTLMRQSAFEVRQFAEDKNISEKQLLESLRNLSKRRDALRSSRENESGYSLVTQIDAFPEHYRDAIRAVVSLLEASGYSPNEYFANPTSTDSDRIIAIHLLHESHPTENSSDRGDPCGKCRMVNFDSVTDVVSELYRFQ